ncbi:pYEATS domain-containing protein [Bradyrhizobium canariense]|nr:pYEATS domain-containing protein [Bradyrhizobium canariense]
MTLRISQNAAPNDHGRWHWSVWIDGTDGELDAIQEVTWRLHPTFATPFRRLHSRASKFKLSTSGWGEFEIKATLKMKNGRSKSLRHWLRLGDQGETTKGAPIKSKSQDTPGRRSAIFLSYSLNNASLAAHLASELAKTEYAVVRDVDIPEGVDMRLWNREQIVNSDAVVVLGADESGTIRSHDVKIAQSKGVPVIPVTFGSRSSKRAVSPTLGKTKPLHVSTDSPIKAAPVLATMIGKLLKG